MKSVTEINSNTILTIGFLLLCVYNADAGQGYLSQKLDEYYSSIKCLANILDDIMIPDFNIFICCGVWILHEWMGGLVLDNCYDHNYYQINNLTEPFLQHMEENCADYPKDSLSCKLVIITPIAVLVLIFVLILSLSACAIYMCVRVRYYQRYFEYQKGQDSDSASSDEITETSMPTMKKKKAVEV